MGSNYKRIGDFIKPSKVKNTEGLHNKLLGINIDKFFMPSVANIVGVDLTKYKVVKKGQFACNRMHVGRDYRIPIALSKSEKEFIVSPAYDVFEIMNTNELLPEYLMMWFSRKEFDRNAWFHTDADVRGGLPWSLFCELELPIPSIEKQRAIVNEYNTVVNRIQLNEQLNQKLEETAQAIYKQWFVDFEFHCLPENYKFTGAVKPQNFDSIMTYKRVGGLPVPDGKSWFVYVLLCEDGSLYKGMTNDLYRRFYEHFTGTGAKHTKLHRPVKTIHWEQFNSQEEARKKEEELKTGYGRTWLSRQIEKAGGLHLIKTGLPAPTTQLRTAGKMVWCEELEKEIPEGWEVIKYSQIAEYAKDRIHLKELNETNYISTENMLPYKDGITNSRGVPTGNLITKFNLGDILLSNIRPYLKKIWYASKIGGCSNDVLCIKPLEIPSMYLYFVTEQDSFFDYIMAGAKGTKMPRGDKDWIMNYFLAKPKMEIIEDFTSKIECVFKRIKLNRIENTKLLSIQELLQSKMTKI